MSISQEHLWIVRSFRRNTEYRTNLHIRVLHFPCGTGDLLAYLSTLLRPAVTYGAGPYAENRTAIAVDHFCAVPSLEDARISHRGFDLVILDLDRIPQKSRAANILKARAATSGNNYTVLLFSGRLSQDEIKAAAQDTRTEFETGEVLAVRLVTGRNALVLRTPLRLHYTDPDRQARRNTAHLRAAVDSISRALARPVFERHFENELEIHPWPRSRPPIFAPLWLDADYAARVIESFGPWKHGIPPEYLDEDPATPHLRPAMPLRRGHLALAAVSGAMGVLRVTLKGRPAAICGRVVREETRSEEREGATRITLTTQSFRPEVTILFLDTMELVKS